MIDREDLHLRRRHMVKVVDVLPEKSSDPNAQATRSSLVLMYLV